MLRDRLGVPMLLMSIAACGGGGSSAPAISEIVGGMVTGPFTVLTNQPPTVGYLSLLLTDGSVMMQSASDAGVFYNLRPDTDGGYVNGTWRRLGAGIVPDVIPTG